MKKILWEPTKASFEATALYRLKTNLEKKHNTHFENYTSLWKWTNENSQTFWTELWDFFGVVGERKGIALENPTDFLHSKWFPESSVNYAENLIKLAEKNRGSHPNANTAPFLVFKAEDQVEFTITYPEFTKLVSKAQQALEAMGLQKGDRVAAMVPNHPATIILMTAAASLGAIWSSCSPDFGVQGVLDRMSQIDPKIFVTSDFYIYNGKKLDLKEKTTEILKSLPTVKNTIVIGFDQPLSALANDTNTTTAHSLSSVIPLSLVLENHAVRPLKFAKTEFNHPLFILFSSGTTGVPKCITHGHGGTLFQHMKEHQLHGDIRPLDQLFYFTTCGWMMWNWLVTGISSGANILLYEGAPFYKDAKELFKFLEQHKCTQFGTSAKFIDSCKKANLTPSKVFNLSSMRTVFSTGSPLNEEGFDYVYEHINPKVQLGSISGGTDIIACFVLSNPWTPVIRGEISAAGLAFDMDIWDDDKTPLVGEKGELVCKGSFPSKPVFFWNDPTREKFKKAYFEKFENIWCHGDYVEKTENGGYIIYGRSDATLNPGGVRIGTAEIYKQVEMLDEVVESIVIGQNWSNDVRVVLFVKLRDGLTLDSNLIDKIKNQIKKNTTPRHVPAKVLQVQNIPRTKSGKIVELAVRQTVQGELVKNVEALANPEALSEYKNRPELRD
ncbi:MAG: acetoacetate--CoA ligase [Bdellovibrionaceae bacterium]|nr:acetoacetate--CoA ligase [Pseudobdellovibrionaceae bacterium]